jgi:hypothetical protein
MHADRLGGTRQPAARRSHAGLPPRVPRARRRGAPQASREVADGYRHAHAQLYRKKCLSRARVCVVVLVLVVVLVVVVVVVV